jgi:adenylate cyclase
MVADVAAYSRLMGEDDLATVQALAAHRDLFASVAAEHHGRIVNAAGDSILAEFASAAAAVQAAWAVQLRTGEVERAEGNRIQFRIGIHVGDVLVRRDDIFGDGVNIAARLQELAEPGGLCISGAAHDYVRKTLPIRFDDLGLHWLKNIEEPVRVYAASPNVHTGPPKYATSFSPRPSIAVLPLENMSNDADQEYFADGITEDLILALTRSRWLSVMARNSAFSLKGEGLSGVEAGRKLGVQYVLAGGVRRSGSRLRVSVQLQDTSTGSTLWAHRFDSEMADIFALQDEIVSAVAGEIEPELLKHEGERGLARSGSLNAWDLVRRAMWEFHKFKPESHQRACELCRQALEAEPNSPDPYIWFARACAGLAAYGWVDEPGARLREGMSAARKAVELDDKNPYAHYALAITHLYDRDFETAFRAAQYAKALNPSFALAHLVLGATALHLGRIDEAITSLEYGLRNSPFDPQGFVWFFFLALAQFESGDIDGSLDAVGHALDLRPGWAPACKIKAACWRAQGRVEQAREILDHIAAQAPGADLNALILNPEWVTKIEACPIRQ